MKSTDKEELTLQEKSYYSLILNNKYVRVKDAAEINNRGERKGE